MTKHTFTVHMLTNLWHFLFIFKITDRTAHYSFGINFMHFLLFQILKLFAVLQSGSHHLQKIDTF